MELDGANAVQDARENLKQHGWSNEALDAKIKDIRWQQSEERGPSLSYILGNDLTLLAQNATGEEDPSFRRIKEPFFFGECAIGSNRMCPRDGRLGCAFVDNLSANLRGRCAHFVSWTWTYRLKLVQGALRECMMQVGCSSDSTFVYM